MTNIPMYSEDIRSLSNSEIHTVLYEMETTINAIAIVLGERKINEGYYKATDAFIALLNTRMALEFVCDNPDHRKGK